jgi:hypothetical protein
LFPPDGQFFVLAASDEVDHAPAPITDKAANRQGGMIVARKAHPAEL